MKTKTKVLVVWAIICCGIAAIMSINSLQTERVAGSSYKLTLLPTSYLSTKGVGTATLNSCDFFEFETSGGLEYGMLTQGPATGCWDENQYATATVRLAANDTIAIKDGLVTVTLQAQDNEVIWAELLPTGGQVAVQIFVSCLFAFGLWIAMALGGAKF